MSKVVHRKKRLSSFKLIVLGFAAVIFVGALLINKIAGHKVRKSFFIMELPEYKIPSLKRAFYSMCSRGKAYIVKAGTVILVCNTVVQIMQSFTSGLRRMAAGSSSNHRLYRKGKRSWHAGSLLWCNKLY